MHVSVVPVSLRRPPVPEINVLLGLQRIRISLVTLGGTFVECIECLRECLGDSCAPSTALRSRSYALVISCGAVGTIVYELRRYDACGSVPVHESRKARAAGRRGLAVRTMRAMPL